MIKIDPAEHKDISVDMCENTKARLDLRIVRAQKIAVEETGTVASKLRVKERDAKAVS